MGKMLKIFQINIILFTLLLLGWGLLINAEDNNLVNDLLEPEGRIIGGRLVSIIKHPHQCSLRYKSCPQCAFSHLCGASIYKADILITAAHCTRGRDVKNFVVVCSTENRSGSDGVIAPVESLVMHEAYNPITTDNDVAVLFLSTLLPIDNVTMAAIPLVENQPKDGLKSKVTGWGTTTEGGVSSSKLLEVEVDIYDNNDCDEAYGGERITAAMLCAGVANGGKDACQGDSGGPLVVNKQLAGIVSWGRGCARPGLPGVYANVYFLKDWIVKTALRNESK